MSQYFYKSSIDFISDLPFDYVETYSFQRGELYEESNSSNKSEYEKLKQRKLQKNDLSDFQELKLNELKNLVGYTQYILNDKGEFHPSSKKINSFKSTDQQVIDLKNILKTKIQDIPNWMCAPIYRDALVFYNKNGKIVETLNICLSCQYMETKMFNYINGDFITYDLLKHFFIEAGHVIE
ncbi:hypothetical protein J2Y38_002837 [Flavobacterium sp. 2755]|uniref:hypothetical protein n=1 Tax=Flavobacterium sp. 2755 TaxID=2817765 RepID=UPI002855F0D0|nr:hypothetical protein [Flavobacterium sp. 2755]MDR6762626.1 hypothetical protein [Flavobacterium sp. 2755]